MLAEDGAVLDAVTSYERGDFGAQSLRAHAPNVAAAYRGALGWAQGTIAEIGS